MAEPWWEKLLDVARRLSPPVTAPEDSGDYWRQHLANQLLCFGIILGAPVYLPSVVFVALRREWGLAALTTVVYFSLIALFVSRRGSFRLRSWSIALTLYLLGVGVYGTLGPLSGGPIWLFAFPLLAGVFLGLRAGVLALALNTLTMACFGLLIHLQLLPWAAEMHHSFLRWVVLSVNFLFVDAVATGSAAYLVRSLDGSNSRLRRVLDDLRGQTARRAEAERGLQVSEGRYLALTELATDYVVVVRDGKVLYSNPALCKATGRGEEDVLGREFIGLVAPEDRERVERNHISRLRGEDAPELYEMEILSRDGRRMCVEIRPTVIELEQGKAIMAVMRDVTERRRQQVALRESEERYRTLVDESFDGVYVHRGEIITFANRRLHEMLGYAPGELNGLPHGQLYHEDSRDVVIQRARERLQGRDVIGRYQVTVQRADREPLPAEIIAKVVHFDGMPGVQVMVRDITEQLKAERERDQMEARLRQSQKMEAVGTLAGGIAHDFNNILAAIMGYAELGMDSSAQGDDCTGDLTQIVAAAERARGLVQKILTFSRRLESDPKPMDLNQEVRDTLEVLQRTLPKMAHITAELAPGTCVIRADRDQIGTMLINLAKNGVDAMDGSGEIIIRTENKISVDMVCPTCEQLISGPQVCLSVIDSGKGMESETAAKVFEPFFTTKEVGSGTGLGLSMVYGIVKNYQGHISVNSRPGQGTTMQIHFPAHHGPAQESRRVGGGAAPFAGNGETVLVVDDEPDLRRIGRRILERAGYVVVEAASGEQALGELGRLDGGVDLVLLDLSMPGMGGMECIGHIRARYPSMPVLIASGYADAGQTRAGREVGAAGFVAKPYTRARLLKGVRGALEG